jgi:omega-6 fatty acid desaturase (delta-12 desaturase)
MASFARVNPRTHAREPQSGPAPQDRRSTPKGLSLLASHGALYLLTLVGALAPLPLSVNLAFSIANGVLIALLFILGHDAAHGSLVRKRHLNRWLARLAFIPCAHSVSLWRTIHNHGHHARTNLKGVDTVWAPMSKAEYDAASPARRWLERVYRGPWGPLIYYYGEFWLHRMLLPLAPDVRGEWKRHLPDCLFALCGLVLTLAGILVAGHALTPTRPLWEVLIVGWVVPFAVWNYLMAFTIYLNHTHPEIQWFANEAMWQRFKGNAVDTVFVRMPVNLAPLYTKVMAHTAHHQQVRVPVYALLDAQEDLTQSGVPLIVYTLTPGAYRAIYRACKLFDFERMSWTDFNGVPSRSQSGTC